MRPIHPRIYTHLVTIWLALSVGGIVLGIVVWRHLNESLDASLRGATFRSELETVDRNLEQAEADARTYCITGQTADWNQFQIDRERFAQRLIGLSHVTTSEPQLARDIEEFRHAADQYFAALAGQMEARRARGIAGVMAHEFSTDRELTDRLHTISARLEEYPQNLLVTQSTVARAELQRALSTTLAAGLFGLGAGVLAFYLSRVALRQEKQQRELSEHALRAERAAQDKSTFLANMSHEIRTPMNAILGFSDLLVSELPAGSRSRQHARSIHDSARSLLQLINDILDISKIEASMLELHLEPADVREMTGFLQTVFSQQATKKGLKLEFFAAPELPAAVMVDRSRLRQVLVNLVGNAVKYTERGSVQVRILWQQSQHAESGTLIFEVIDTGVGIPAEKQAQIFEPFVQVDNRRPVEQQGTGLGLNIVQRLTERMGGSVKVRSDVGVGSVFTVQLADVSISSRQPTSEGAATDEIVNFNTIAPTEILVVDDNAANRSLLASTFHDTHHRVRFATNGREAIEAVRTKQPDLVLMDIRMPELDGQSALVEIRRLPGADRLPVIAVTASSFLADEKRLRATFTGYLRKPFTRRELFQQLAAILPPQVSSPTAKSAEPPRPERFSDPTRWRELVPQLRKLQEREWARVGESGAIPEIKDFARTLYQLAQNKACPPLADYSEGLTNDAAAYAVARIEERLSQFPHLISEIESRAVATTAVAPTASV